MLRLVQPLRLFGRNSKGDAGYTLVQVSVNDIIMVFAFAPIAGLLLGMSNIAVPWNTLFLSVVLFYVVALLIADILTEKALIKNRGETAVDAFCIT